VRRLPFSSTPRGPRPRKTLCAGVRGCPRTVRSKMGGRPQGVGPDDANAGGGMAGNRISTDILGEVPSGRIRPATCHGPALAEGCERSTATGSR